MGDINTSELESERQKEHYKESIKKQLIADGCPEDKVDLIITTAFAVTEEITTIMNDKITDNGPFGDDFSSANASLVIASHILNFRTGIHLQTRGIYEVPSNEGQTIN